MTTTLARTAFLPRRPLSDRERHDFAARRDRLFACCTPAEQRRLVAAAQWYEAHDPRLFARPNRLGESYLAVLQHRYTPFLHPKPPSLLTRLLAKASTVIVNVENWRDLRMQAGFVAHLSRAFGDGAADELLGAVHFLRLLQLQVGHGQKDFERRVEALAFECATDVRVPVARRFDAVRRCMLWPRDATGWASLPDMGLHAWRLLLELADADMQAAVRLIDQQGERRASPDLFPTLCLHEDPQLAYRLAIKFRPHRADFAASMLRTSIWYLSFQRSKLPAADVQPLMNASCLLLAQWASEDGGLGAGEVLEATESLFRFGDPGAPYWRELAPRCMPLLRALQAAELPARLRLLASVAVYVAPIDPLATEARALVEDAICGKTVALSGATQDLDSCISDICRSTLDVLEDKMLSWRNRQVPAVADHPLLASVDGALDALLAHLTAAEPHRALSHRVAWIRGLSHRELIRKHHRLLRERFEELARSCPDDAGLALKQLIAYCGYSQADDEEYKKDLCRESFELLLPLLDAISPADASVARTGVGWSALNGIF